MSGQLVVSGVTVSAITVTQCLPQSKQLSVIEKIIDPVGRTPDDPHEPDPLLPPGLLVTG